MTEQECQLRRRDGGINAVGDAPGRLDGQVGDRPLGTRVAHDGQGVAGTQAARAESQRDGGDALGEPAPARLPIDTELLRPIGDTVRGAARSLQEQPWQCRPGERGLVDHRRDCSIASASRRVRRTTACRSTVTRRRRGGPRRARAPSGRSRSTAQMRRSQESFSASDVSGRAARAGRARCRFATGGRASRRRRSRRSASSGGVSTKPSAGGVAGVYARCARQINPDHSTSGVSGARTARRTCW